MQHFDAAEMRSSSVKDKAEWPQDENMALKSQPNAESQFRCKSILKIQQLSKDIIGHLFKQLSITEQALGRWDEEDAKKQLLADWKIKWIFKSGAICSPSKLRICWFECLWVYFKFISIFENVFSYK